MDLRSRKRARCSKNNMRRDRLSEMPDEIIVHILSCLPIRDAVRTILLRRVGNLWTLVHTLNLDIYEFIHKSYWHFPSELKTVECQRFNTFARNVLMFHERLSIEKIRICLDSDYCEEESIPKWQSFALNKQAKEIIFRDIHQHVYNMSLKSNFTSPFLVILNLYNCSMDPGLQVNLGSLKKLILDRVSMCQDSFRQLLSGCPSLQELRIVNPCFMDRLEKLSFRAPNIHKLSLALMGDYDYCYEYGYEKCNSWVLDFPDLKSLDLEIYRLPHIIDVSSVRDIYFKDFTKRRSEDERRKCKLFLGKLKGAVVFRLSQKATELFLHLLDDFKDLQIGWKRVVLEVSMVCKKCLLGICELLRGLEQLEELIIYTPLTGAKMVEFVKRVSTFKRASTRASVLFV